ncbi:hypothetical protein DK181_08475 [Streptococcus sobrinus]|nr:hypothetical protein DK181_08475 [Streptococcus sobrinus]
MAPPHATSTKSTTTPLTSNFHLLKFIKNQATDKFSPPNLCYNREQMNSRKKKMTYSKCEYCHGQLATKYAGGLVGEFPDGG